MDISNTKRETVRKEYGLSTNNKVVVIAVIGDRGHSCILSSIDYGYNWKVVLSNYQLKNTKNTFYNSYYSKSRKLFLIPTEMVLILLMMVFILINEIMIILLTRNGYVFEELEQIWITSYNFLSILKSWEYKYNKVLTSIDKNIIFLLLNI